MSKAFTKEDDGADVIAGRPLGGNGAQRPITPAGHAALIARLAATTGHEHDLVAATLAQVYVATPPAAPARVVFGCRVGLRGADRAWTVVLVGPDESDPKAGRIGVGGPVGKALLGAEVGAEVELRRGGGSERVTVISIDADDAD